MVRGRIRSDGVWAKVLGAAVDVEALRSELLAYVDDGPRRYDEFLGFITDWMEANRTPGAELPSTSSWFIVRTYPWLLRTPDTTRLDGHPRDGHLTARTALPDAASEGAVDADRAFVHVVRSYLAAFGPAEPDDVKSFFLEPRITRVRAALAELEPDLVTLSGPEGAPLYDLVDAPRPDPDVDVPVRFLARFDNVLLGHAPRNRVRVLPDEYRPAVFQTRNGQVLATFLVDGMVAGTWDFKEGGAGFVWPCARWPG